MPRRELQPQPQTRAGIDITDPFIKGELRKFETAINKFNGPWKFELWMAANGCINRRDPNFKIVEIRKDGEVFQKVEFTSVLGVKYAAAQERYTALRKLQRKTLYARTVNTPPPPPEETKPPDPDEEFIESLPF